MTDDPLLISTLATSSQAEGSARATVPCATILCHPDPRRVGERALLTPLLVRQPALLSRTQPLFAHPGEELRQPLADPHLSREPIRLVQGAAPGAIKIEGGPHRLDGRAPSAASQVPGAALQRGVVLRLSRRISLLLHVTAGESLTPLADIFGSSDAIDRVRKQIERLAPLDAPVLIRGESGTGKELVASALHARSTRSGKAWIAVNMATLSESTAAGALFGYARGAFTGAQARHHGLFERAHGGTLFLDELGDTPAGVQPMLLRVLETGRITPLGDEQERAVDVRLIAATELDLDDQDAFRTALKHRLASYEIVVPALRERPDDVARLFVRFLHRELATFGCEALLDAEASHPSPPLAAELIERLLFDPLPGNVRQLSNLARRAALNASHSGRIELSAEDLPESAHPRASQPGAAGGERAAVGAEQPASSVEAPAIDERSLFEVLERHEFSPLRAAFELGVPSSTMHLWMQRAGIRRATDLDDAELQRAHDAHGGEVEAMAKHLRVSSRALRLRLRRR